LRILSDQEVLQIWETGLGQHPVDRALNILAVTLPDVDRNQLAVLSIGRRDGCLMDIRETNFGSKVSGVAECPGCQERLVWTLDIGDIRSTQGTDQGTNRLIVEEYELLYQLPDSTDLAAVAASGDVQSGRATLLHRCVLEARHANARVEARTLPESVVSRLAANMEACDPQSETLLDFECPECGLRWQALFDILTFLWSEICGRARNLLSEVHSLASAYGWAEEDILGMSLARRRFYLEAVT
jgi:hypothetical protein